MFTHPQILTDLARQHRDDLIAEARRDHLATTAARARSTAPVRAPAAPRDWPATDRKDAGRLGSWQAARERTGERVR